MVCVVGNYVIVMSCLIRRRGVCRWKLCHSDVVSNSTSGCVLWFLGKAKFVGDCENTLTQLICVCVIFVNNYYYLHTPP